MISASIMAANMWKNSLKNVESDNNKILYETLLDFFYSETVLTFWISLVYIWKYFIIFKLLSSWLQELWFSKEEETLGRFFLSLPLSLLNDTQAQSLGLFWTRMGPSQRRLPDNTQLLTETDTHVPSGIRTRCHIRRAATDLRFRGRGHRDVFHITGQKSQDVWLLRFIRKYVNWIGYSVARNTGGCTSVRSDICHSLAFNRIRSYNFLNP